MKKRKPNKRKQAQIEKAKLESNSKKPLLRRDIGMILGLPLGLSILAAHVIRNKGHR